jgi:hypothetical protein
MRSAKRPKIGPFKRLSYDLLLRVNKQLVGEKIELIEEVRQLRAAVNIYREVSNRLDREKPKTPRSIGTTFRATWMAFK